MLEQVARPFTHALETCSDLFTLEKVTLLFVQNAFELIRPSFQLVALPAHQQVQELTVVASDQNNRLATLVRQLLKINAQMQTEIKRCEVELMQWQGKIDLITKELECVDPDSEENSDYDPVEYKHDLTQQLKSHSKTHLQHDKKLESLMALRDTSFTALDGACAAVVS